MLVNNEKHAKWHSLSPKDCHWGNKEAAVASVNIVKSTIEGEQVSISVPIFCDETREQLNDRLGMAFSVLQDRMEDGFAAWKEVAEKSEAEKAQIIKER